MPPLTLMIKPVSGNCNMRCGYCFYCDVAENRDVASYGVMDFETLEEVVRKSLDWAERDCTFAFQGGEPTLAGLDFFRELIRLEKKWNRKQVTIHHALQTNGYSLDRDWCMFFAEHNFLIGLSLDGTKDIHDRYRHNAEGKGTFQRVLRAAQLMDACDVAYNILTVVTAQTAKHVNRIYNFFSRNGFLYQQYIPCLDPIQSERGSLAYSLDPDTYGDFLKTLFDLWEQDYRRGQPVSIRYFDDLLLMLCGQPPQTCGGLGVCSRQIIVEADGAVYPCDFYVLDEYRLGSLKDIDYRAIEQQRDVLGFLLPSSIPAEECMNCPYGALCRGGCRRHRDRFDGGGLECSYYCRSYQAFFSHALPRLKEIAREISRQYRRYI